MYQRKKSSLAHPGNILQDPPVSCKNDMLHTAADSSGKIKIERQPVVLCWCIKKVFPSSPQPLCSAFIYLHLWGKCLDAVQPHRETTFVNSIYRSHQSAVKEETTCNFMALSSLHCNKLTTESKQFSLHSFRIMFCKVSPRNFLHSIYPEDTTVVMINLTAALPQIAEISVLDHSFLRK